jgi:hypothetical protein
VKRLAGLAVHSVLVRAAAVRALGASALWRDPLPPEESDERHLAAALSWLCLAQDACGGDGVAALYDLQTGWGPAYPETSGYIIATFLAQARLSGDAALRKRAQRLGDWELSIQTPTGGVLSSPLTSYTRVFNTGQVILGLCALEEELRLGRHLAGAARAGDYLLALQEPDGRWERDTYCGARTYHARVDWGLVRLAQLTGDERYAAAAARNLAWVLAQARPNGWFANCGFFADPPVTHVLGYTLRGLLECHALGHPALRGLDLLSPVRAAFRSLEEVAARPGIAGIDGLLPASFHSDWTSAARSSCLTGVAQLSLVLSRLARVISEPGPEALASRLLSAVKRAQRLGARTAAVRGALAGSHPLGGAYAPHAFPNWAAKFLADALLLRMQAADRSFNVLA